MANWKDILATVAPTVATMLGGPLAGMAVKALSSKLLGRDDGTEDEVAAAVTALAPADIIRLRELDVDLAKTLADNDIKLEALAAQDRDSARRRATEAKDSTPSVLSYLYFVLFAVVLIGLLHGDFNITDSQVALMMIGGLIAVWQQSSNFQFGTTRGSQNKDKVISTISQAKP